MRAKCSTPEWQPRLVSRECLSGPNMTSELYLLVLGRFLSWGCRGDAMVEGLLPTHEDLSSNLLLPGRSWAQHQGGKSEDPGITAQPGQLSHQTLGRVGDPSSKNTVQSDRGECPALVGVYYICKSILFIIKFKNRRNYGRKFFDEKRYFFFL